MVVLFQQYNKNQTEGKAKVVTAGWGTELGTRTLWTTVVTVIMLSPGVSGASRHHGFASESSLHSSRFLLDPNILSGYWLVYTIDKLYTQIGNVNRLYNIIEPFAALFWALGIVLAHILPKVSQPAGLASLNPSTGMVLYGRGQLGSIRLKTSRLSATSILAVLVLWCIQSC